MGEFQGTTSPELLSDEKDLQVFLIQTLTSLRKCRINIYEFNFLIERDLNTIRQVE